MIDITGISVFGFAMAKIILWLFVLLFALYIIRKVLNQVNPEVVDESVGAPSVNEVLWRNKVKICLWILFFFSAVIYSQVEMGYRPKTLIQPTNQVLENKISELDNTEIPELGPAEGDLRDAANQGYSQRNRDENKRSIEDFKELD